MLPSVYKGQYGFSGQKHREAVLSSLPGASPAASSAWLPRRFCSRKTPQDLPAGKNQGWQGRRTKVGLISHQGRERSQRSFWLLLAYCPLYTEGRLTRDREKPVLEDKIPLILGEKPRHTAVCLRFSPASQKNFLSYKTALHLKTSCFYVRMCPKREAILTYCKL